MFSCYGKTVEPDGRDRNKKVLGYKPIYALESDAKKINYLSTPKTVIGTAGNIYSYQNSIFQVEPGRGIHVIDNSVPDTAKRVGFITVNGCTQISIKDGKIYTNSYDDLVVLEYSAPATVSELSRVKAVFTEYRYESPISQPPFSGYYECPAGDKFIVGWAQDSVKQYCYKN